VRVGVEDVMLMAGTAGLQAIDLLHCAADLGAQGVHFSTISSFPGRDAASVGEIARAARSMNLYVEVGMGTCNPASNLHAPGDAGRDIREILHEMIAVAAGAGSGVLRTFVGWTEERRLPSPAWPQQLAQAAEVLAEAAPVARDAGVVICVENHMDLTTSELRSLIRQVGSPAVGVCFDSANPLMFCEDPVEACRMLAPFIHCTHIKDAVLTGSVDGPRCAAAPLGMGVVDLKEIVRILRDMSPCTRLSIEDHGGVFEVHPPSEDISAALDLRRINPNKLEAWISKGNHLLDRGKFPALPEMFDNNAQTAIAERRCRSITFLKNLIRE